MTFGIEIEDIDTVTACDTGPLYNFEWRCV